MADPIYVGIDFGSLGLRVAWAGGEDAPTVLPSDAIGHWPSLLCESAPSSAIGVSFPSLKERLGSNTTIRWNGAEVSPGQLVSRMFRAVYDAVGARSPSPLAGAVVAVPALYSARQRTALRDCAIEAGFSDVHLINDSVAAVIASTDRDSAQTALVYSVGYTGFEIGLVRAARGRYRALRYEGGRHPGGCTLDESILGSLLKAVQDHHLRLDSARWESSLWMQVRSEAQRVKEELSHSQTVTLPIPLQMADRDQLVHVSFTRSGLEEVVKESITMTIETAVTVIEQSKMTVADIDLVLSVGGTTRLPLVRALVEGVFGSVVAATDADVLARGAAIHGAHLGAQVTGQSDLARIVDAVDSAPQGGQPLMMNVGLVLAEDARIVTDDVGGAEAQARSIGHARVLIENGQTDEARDLLIGLINEARGVLDSLPQAPTSKTDFFDSYQARSSLRQARRFLRMGRYEKAVEQSHAAWYFAPSDPDVFEKMITIHCEAAAGHAAVEGYADAQRWLTCAYSHDQSNTQVRECLARRHLSHAEQMRDQGKPYAALEAVRQCLSLTPDDEAARGLEAALLPGEKRAR